MRPFPNPSPRPSYIAVGGSHVCALQHDDMVVCWGGNGSGELGSGSDAGWTFVPVPVPVQGL